MAHSAESLARRSKTQHQHRVAMRDWKSSDLPLWLTRDVYLEQIQPALATIPKSRIRSVLGVSEPYSIYIQTGQRIPHPRYWLALAELVGINSRPAGVSPEPLA
jgi:hypothetical protein